MGFNGARNAMHAGRRASDVNTLPRLACVIVEAPWLEGDLESANQRWGGL
jgi:hypothetical protein